MDGAVLHLILVVPVVIFSLCRTIESLRRCAALEERLIVDIVSEAAKRGEHPARQAGQQTAGRLVFSFRISY